ncbi:hypothetical protein M9Y10_014488 [Tritrichomonas musculus]|uniref:Uncharacterized protein n=1 Tax=Tritrichomonas musculus TaxID=1915356 RepID=A0ABR2KZM3_9EUKA
MKKKFKFHCLDDDSDSLFESASYSEDGSDDDIPEKNVSNRILQSNELNVLIEAGTKNAKNASRENDDHQAEFLHQSTPPPPLPSSSSSSAPSSPISGKQIKNEKDEIESDVSPVQSFEVNSNNINDDDDFPPPSSIPDDILFNGIDEDPPPPEVEEVIDNDDTNTDDKQLENADGKEQFQKSKKKSIPKSLKAKNKPMTRERQLILNTNRIYDYFNRRISKLAILKAIHAKCGNFRLAILALAQNSTQFDTVSLFEAPKAEPEMIKEYLQL